MGIVTEIADEEQFQKALASAENKIVIVKFTVTWSIQCQLISPFFEQMSQKYPEIIFLSVDVDKCQETAANQVVAVMPTFYFFKNSVKIDTLQGAKHEVLEKRIKKYYEKQFSSFDKEPCTKDLSIFFRKFKLIGGLDTTEQFLTNVLKNKKGQLESESDGKLLLHLWFSRIVTVCSFKILAPVDKGPKKIKVFTNHTKSLSLENVLHEQADQELEIDSNDLGLNDPVIVNCNTIQNVSNIQIYFYENQSDSGPTQIQSFECCGIVTGSSSSAKSK